MGVKHPFEQGFSPLFSTAEDLKSDFPPQQVFSAVHAWAFENAGIEARGDINLLLAAEAAVQSGYLFGVTVVADSLARSGRLMQRKKAVSMSREAAVYGSPLAGYQLAVHFMNGQFGVVEANWDMAEIYALELSEKGFDYGENLLFRIYFDRGD